MIEDRGVHSWFFLRQTVLFGSLIGCFVVNIRRLAWICLIVAGAPSKQDSNAYSRLASFQCAGRLGTRRHEFFV